MTYREPACEKHATSFVSIAKSASTVLPKIMRCLQLFGLPRQGGEVFVLVVDYFLSHKAKRRDLNADAELRLKAQTVHLLSCLFPRL